MLGFVAERAARIAFRFVLVCRRDGSEHCCFGSCTPLSVCGTCVFACRLRVPLSLCCSVVRVNTASLVDWKTTKILQTSVFVYDQLDPRCFARRNCCTRHSFTSSTCAAHAHVLQKIAAKSKSQGESINSVLRASVAVCHSGFATKPAVVNGRAAFWQQRWIDFISPVHKLCGCIFCCFVRCVDRIPGVMRFHACAPADGT